MITLAQAKLHLRVDGDDEDALIQSYIDAATTSVALYLGDEIPEVDTPAPIDAAILLAVGGMYLNREAVADRQLFRNPTFERLLAPYRVMAV